MRRMILVFVLVSLNCIAHAQSQIIILHDSVGTSIDSIEKEKYHLFPFWSAKQFDHAEFLLNADSTIAIQGTLKDGSVYTIPCTKEEFAQYNFEVRHYGGIIPKEPHPEYGEMIGKGAVSVVTSIVAFFGIKRSHDH